MPLHSKSAAKLRNPKKIRKPTFPDSPQLPGQYPRFLSPRYLRGLNFLKILIVLRIYRVLRVLKVFNVLNVLKVFRVLRVFKVTFLDAVSAPAGTQKKRSPVELRSVGR